MGISVKCLHHTVHLDTYKFIICNIGTRKGWQAATDIQMALIIAFVCTHCMRNKQAQKLTKQRKCEATGNIGISITGYLSHPEGNSYSIHMPQPRTLIGTNVPPSDAVASFLQEFCLRKKFLQDTRNLARILHLVKVKKV